MDCLLGAIILYCGLQALLLGASPGRCNANQSAYCFRQTSRMTGIHVVRLSKRGVQIENLHTHIVMVSVAPDWQVCTYNKEKGNYFISKDATRFKGSLANTFFRAAGDEIGQFSWQHANAQLFHGLNADRFVAVDRNAKRHAVPGLVSDTAIRVAEYIVAHDDLLPPRIADAVCRLYSVPSLHKVPFQYLYSSDGRTLLSGLTCTAFERTIDRPGLFEFPKGLKLSRDEKEVFIGERVLF